MTTVRAGVAPAGVAEGVAEPDGAGPCCAPAPVLAPALGPQEAAGYAAVLKALADPQRLRMLSIIAAQPTDDPLCVCEIEGEFDLSQPTVSHHLKVLREAGLVTVRRDAQRRIYAVDPQPLAELHEWLARYRRLWDDRLDAMERRLDELEER